MALKDILKALKGYKAGTYGGTMKQVMVNQMKDLDNSEIEAISLLMKIGQGTQTEKATDFAAALPRLALQFRLPCLPAS